jgi:hypothetical protein
MRKVLIVSPRFPPAGGPDYHRVRMLLPLVEGHGWKPVVLCVRDSGPGAASEPDLLRTLPSSVEVVECKAVSRKWSRFAGVGSLSLRSGFSLRSTGDRLLRDGTFDLVFFSTTEFLTMSLGPHWRHSFGVPFVVDLHDPWVNTYYSERGLVPPGGRVKHAAHQLIARLLEKRVLRSAAHIVVVSSHYPPTLMRRYPQLDEKRFSVLPFPGSARDFEVAAATEETVFPPDGRSHWVYAGAVSAGMSRPITAFFKAFQMARDAGIIGPDSVRLHFLGTDYASGTLARSKVMGIANMCGVADCVSETSNRVPYLKTLRCLLEADALMMFGSDEPGYTASKLFQYVLARKPLLTIFHEDSPVTLLMHELNAGVTVSFRQGNTERDIALEVLDQWFEKRGFERTPATVWDAFQPHTAEAMAQKITAIFDGVVGGRGPGGGAAPGGRPVAV